MDSDSNNTPQITCFHDGECPICRIEINAMKKLDQDNNRVRWVDISTDADALKQAGLTYEEAMSKMYVQDEHGFSSGVDGFLLLWSTLPYYRRVVPIVNKVPLLKPCLGFFYNLFAKYRLKITGKQ
jgi:predicted DCC family thiol-disulfide oxidoreductase YuxK